MYSRKSERHAMPFKNNLLWNLVTGEMKWYGIKAQSYKVRPQARHRSIPIQLLRSFICIGVGESIAGVVVIRVIHASLEEGVGRRNEYLHTVPAHTLLRLAARPASRPPPHAISRVVRRLCSLKPRINGATNRRSLATIFKPNDCTVLNR